MFTLSMQEFKYVEMFKSFCRTEFYHLSNQLQMKEAILPKKKYENPYKISFKNKDCFIDFESYSHGYRLNTSFGTASRLFSYSLFDGLWLLKGRDFAQQYVNNPLSGYHSNLKRDLKIISSHIEFFTDLKDEQKRLDLYKIQKEKLSPMLR